MAHSFSPRNGLRDQTRAHEVQGDLCWVSEEQLLQFFVTESEPGSVSSKSLPTGHRQPENEDNVLGVGGWRWRKAGLGDKSGGPVKS